MSRDLILIQKNNYISYTKAGVLDLWMSYDEGDCEKYGFEHFDEFESKIDIPIEKDYPISDVFYAGLAKDRVKRLVAIYDELSQAGIKCLFIIVDSKKEERVEREGIKYLDKQLTYPEMLWYSVNSKCILELNRTGATGYTSRFLEAVLFNKKLITDNKCIKETKFFNPSYINIFESERDIDINMIKDDGKVDYHYNNEFSPIRRLEQIDKLL